MILVFISQILLINHKNGTSYISENNRDYKNIIAYDEAGNILECKKSKIFNGTFYGWFSSEYIDKIYIKDNFSETIDKNSIYSLIEDKYIYDISSGYDFLLHKENLIDFDVWNDGIDNYLFLTDKKDGVYKFKDDRNIVSTSNLELIQ